MTSKNRTFETVLNKKQQYSSGATRDDQSGKGRYDLIPETALIRLAAVYERGAANHGDRNWESGIPFGRLYDSAMRHLIQFKQSHYDLSLCNEDHLAHALWNICALIFGEEMIKRGHLPEELNDLPKYVPIDKKRECTCFVCRSASDCSLNITSKCIHQQQESSHCHRDNNHNDNGGHRSKQFDSLSPEMVKSPPNGTGIQIPQNNSRTTVPTEDLKLAKDYEPKENKTLSVDPLSFSSKR